MKTYKAPKPLEQQYGAAQARAARDGIRVVADLSSVFYTTSSAGEHHLYRVSYDGATLTCPCPARYYCKHLAACQAVLDQRHAEHDAVVAQTAAERQTREAAQALVLAEQSECELSGAVWNQMELFWLLIYAPQVEIAAGAAMGQQAKLDKEAKWQAYQTARQNEWYC